MRYLSVCSGIEAVSVAWEPLGFIPVAFSEIEPFPSAVLHRECIPIDMRNATRGGNDNCGLGVGEEGEASYTITSEGNVPGVCYCIQGDIASGRRLGQNGTGVRENFSYSLLTSDPHTIYYLGTSVRRLLPIECERLQGFPDEWTAIEWRGKEAKDCPASLRYKAIGNSMAVCVMTWLGEQIKKVNE